MAAGAGRERVQRSWCSGRGAASLSAFPRRGRAWVRGAQDVLTMRSVAPVRRAARPARCAAGA
ncbi:MAG: hypothetical protein EPN98_18165 [Phenylobacterium sp.]|nr:MAG: hypothetical protein EPN98_18165 [Phenylobacterium sp.]